MKTFEAYYYDADGICVHRIVIEATSRKSAIAKAQKEDLEASSIEVEERK